MPNARLNPAKYTVPGLPWVQGLGRVERVGQAESPLNAQVSGLIGRINGSSNEAKSPRFQEGASSRQRRISASRSSQNSLSWSQRQNMQRILYGMSSDPGGMGQRRSRHLLLAQTVGRGRAGGQSGEGWNSRGGKS